MFTEEELTGIRAQLTKRRLLLLVPALLLAGAAVLLIVIRMGLRDDAVAALHDPKVMSDIRTCEIVSTVCMALALVWLIFAHGLFYSPLKKYEKHLDGVLHGRTHEICGAWAGVSGDVSEMDGVPSRAVGLTVPDDKGRDVERLFYWDIQKPLPDVAQGTRVKLVYHGKQVVSLEPAEDSDAE